jgi:Tol biopolymer transport system component
VIPGSSSSFSSGGAYAANPNWHPKGPLLFEAANPGGDTRLYYLQPGGSSPSEYLSLASAPGNLTWPTIAPDGARIAYVSGSTGQGDVYLFDASTGKVANLFASPLPENAPRFSPNGQVVIFSRNMGNEDLFTATIGGQGAAALTGGPGDQSRPRFVGADQVAFFTNERGDDLWDIAVAPAIPGKTRTIVARDIRLPLRSQPQLTPDGKWVVYASAAPAQDGYVFFTRIDGTETKKVNTGLVAVGDAAVTTNGGRTWLAFTALPGTDSDWRQLHVIDITGQI